MEIKFNRQFGTRLYLSEETAVSCFCLIKAEDGPEILNLREVFTDRELCPTFIFSNQILGFPSGKEAMAWIEVLDKMLKDAQMERALVWSENAKNENAKNENAKSKNVKSENVKNENAKSENAKGEEAKGEEETKCETDTVLAGVSSDGDSLSSQLRIPLCVGTDLIIKSGTRIRLDPESGELKFGENGDFGLYIEGMKNEMSVASLRLPFAGDDSGCLRFYMDMLHTRFIRLFHPAMVAAYGPEGARKRIAFPYLYAKDGEDGIRIRLDASFFPDDLYNKYCGSGKSPTAYNFRKTYLRYARNLEREEEVRVHTCYQNVYGDQALAVLLREDREKEEYASGFLFANDQKDVNIFMVPEGDFLFCFPEGACGEFMCGVEGSERLVMEEQKACFRFEWGRPGYSPLFPLAQLSPTGPRSDLGAPELSGDYPTSWLAPIRYKMSYISIPKGSYYYASEGKTLLRPELPKLYLPSDGTVYFPMMPHGMAEDSQAALFERQVLMRARKKQIEGIVSRERQNRKSEEPGRWIAAPCGQLVYVRGSVFEEIRLAQSAGPDGSFVPLRFRNPDEVLTSVFMDAGLMMVAANDRHLQQFDSEACIGEWRCRVKAGADSRYGNYRNIIIIKGRKGCLYDPEGESLFANPMQWTQRDALSSPVTEEGGEPDAGQQLILSQWLMDYCRKAAVYGKEDVYFGNWNRIVSNPSWQGVLFLNVSLDAEFIPDSIKPILKGVGDPDSFCYHHLGFTVSPVGQEGGEAIQQDAAAFFGLIYYQDSAVGDRSITTVPPESDDDYQFKLLALRVLFENSVTKKFESNAQLTVNRIFGCRVSAGQYGCRDNTMLLEGAFQVKDGVSAYMLENAGAGRFFFSNRTLRYVQIKKAAMDMEGSFTLDGCIAFEVQDTEKGKADIFSFGGAEDKDADGLAFTALEIKSAPAGKEWKMEYGKLVFHPAASTARDGSLCRQLCLDYDGMLIGDKDTKPEDQGYMSLANPAGLGSISGKNWFGLRFKIMAGSLGELAGKAGIKAGILMAWDEEGEGGLGISLPGTGADFLNLQGVLKLSYGKPRLVLDADGNFLLVLPDICLKLLNIISIPPAGTTRFFLFGKKTDGSLGWYAVYKKKDKEEGFR